MSTDVQGHEACLHHHHLHHLVLRFSWISTDGKAWRGVCVSLQASSATRHSCSPSSVHWRPIKISTCVTASMWHLSSAWRCRHRWSMPLSKLHSFCDLKIPVIALGSDVKYGFRWGGGGGGGGRSFSFELMQGEARLNTWTDNNVLYFRWYVSCTAWHTDWMRMENFSELWVWKILKHFKAVFGLVYVCSHPSSVSDKVFK